MVAAPSSPSRLGFHHLAVPNGRAQIFREFFCLHRYQHFFSPPNFGLAMAQHHCEKNSCVFQCHLVPPHCPQSSWMPISPQILSLGGHGDFSFYLEFFNHDEDVQVAPGVPWSCAGLCDRGCHSKAEPSTSARWIWLSLTFASTLRCATSKQKDQRKS